MRDAAMLSSIAHQSCASLGELTFVIDFLASNGGWCTLTVASNNVIGDPVGSWRHAGLSPSSSLAPDEASWPCSIGT